MRFLFRNSLHTNATYTSESTEMMHYVTDRYCVTKVAYETIDESGVSIEKHTQVCPNVKYNATRQNDAAIRVAKPTRETKRKVLRETEIE